MTFGLNTFDFSNFGSNSGLQPASSAVPTSGAFGIGSILPLVDGLLKGIFKDGLGCIGSSATPSKFNSWRPILEGIMNSHLQGAVNTTNNAEISNALTNADRFLAYMREHQSFHEGQSKSNCSKKTNAAMSQFAEAHRQNLSRYVDVLKSKGLSVSKSLASGTSKTLPQPNGISVNWKGRDINISYRKYSVSGTQNSTPLQIDSDGNPVTQSISGFGTVGIVALIALAFGSPQLRKLLRLKK